MLQQPGLMVLICNLALLISCDHEICIENGSFHLEASRQDWAPNHQLCSRWKLYSFEVIIPTPPYVTTISSENLFLLLDLQFVFHQLLETALDASKPCQSCPKLATDVDLSMDYEVTKADTVILEREPPYSYTYDILVPLPHRTKVYASNKTFYS